MCSKPQPCASAWQTSGQTLKVYGLLHVAQRKDESPTHPPLTHRHLQGTPNMVISLVGNKADLESARQVTQDEAKSYAEENGLFFWETSAKSNSNVSELFQDMAKRLPKAASAAPAQVPSDCTWLELLAMTHTGVGPHSSTCWQLLCCLFQGRYLCSEFGSTGRQLLLGSVHSTHGVCQGSSTAGLNVSALRQGLAELLSTCFPPPELPDWPSVLALASGVGSCAVAEQMLRACLIHTQLHCHCTALFV